METLPIYGTHYPVLAAAVQRTQGPVLELGCGHFSTPMLHLLCMEQKRRLVTVESDHEWMEKFHDMRSPWHTFVHVAETDWDSLTFIDTERWGVAFIDHRPVLRRKEDIRRLKDRAEFIVVHDTETPDYQYESILPSFKYRSDWKRYAPWTTVVSMSRHFEI